MTYTDKPVVPIRVIKVAFGLAIGSVFVYFLMWGALEGYKYVGR